MDTHILAMVDMRGNFVAIGLVLLVGGVVLRFARSKKGACWQLPVAAFVAGPIWAIGWFLAELCSPYSGGYVSYSEFVETFVPVVTVGIIGGVVGAAVLSIVSCSPLPRIHKSRASEEQ
jgi:hypothetical protein